VPTGLIYHRIDPRAAPPATAPSLPRADVQAAHAHLARDPFGVEVVGFSEADVEAIGCYLQSLLLNPGTEHAIWKALKAGEIYAFAAAIHESVEINELWRAGEDPYRQVGRTTRRVYQRAHRHAAAEEACYWSRVAQKQGYQVAPATLEAEHFLRRYARQHGQTVREIVREQRWNMPTVAERRAARQFFHRIGLIQNP
jgi:hypothetical protein